MATGQLASSMTVAEILEQWPEAVSVFQELKTACVGCVMAPFDTMEDVAQIYEMELSEIMAALEKRVNASGRREGKGDGNGG